jgi:hypothetical protein
MKKWLMGTFLLQILIVILLSCGSIPSSKGKIPIEPPTSIVGKWKMVQNRSTFVLTYHEDGTYTMELNDVPIEVGTYSFTEQEISVNPSHVYNRNIQRLQEVPKDATTVKIIYNINGFELVQNGYGTFTFLGK